jgi:hypothetical protein
VTLESKQRLAWMYLLLTICTGAVALFAILWATIGLKLTIGVFGFIAGVRGLVWAVDLLSD